MSTSSSIPCWCLARHPIFGGRGGPWVRLSEMRLISLPASEKSGVREPSELNIRISAAVLVWSLFSWDKKKHPKTTKQHYGPQTSPALVPVPENGASLIPCLKRTSAWAKLSACVRFVHEICDLGLKGKFELCKPLMHTPCHIPISVLHPSSIPLPQLCFKLGIWY